MVKLSSSILDHKLSLILLALNLKVGDSNSKENNAPQVNINTATGSAVPLSSSTNVTEAKPSNVFPETPRVVRQEKPPALTPVLQGKPDLPAENNKTSTPALKRSISDASTSSTAKKPRPSRPPALTDPNNIAGGAETQRSYADPPRLKPPSKVNGKGLCPFTSLYPSHGIFPALQMYKIVIVCTEMILPAGASLIVRLPTRATINIT
jgi:hypothetical protein